VAQARRRPGSTHGRRGAKINNDWQALGVLSPREG